MALVFSPLLGVKFYWTQFMPSTSIQCPYQNHLVQWELVWSKNTSFAVGEALVRLKHQLKKKLFSVKANRNTVQEFSTEVISKSSISCCYYAMLSSLHLMTSHDTLKPLKTVPPFCLHLLAWRYPSQCWTTLTHSGPDWCKVPSV